MPVQYLLYYLFQGTCWTHANREPISLAIAFRLLFLDSMGSKHPTAVRNQIRSSVKLSPSKFAKMTQYIVKFFERCSAHFVCMFLLCILYHFGKYNMWISYQAMTTVTLQLWKLWCCDTSQKPAIHLSNPELGDLKPAWASGGFGRCRSSGARQKLQKGQGRHTWVAYETVWSSTKYCMDSKNHLLTSLSFSVHIQSASKHQYHQYESLRNTMKPSGLLLPVTIAFFLCTWSQVSSESKSCHFLNLLAGWQMVGNKAKAFQTDLRMILKNVTMCHVLGCNCNVVAMLINLESILNHAQVQNSLPHTWLHIMTKHKLPSNTTKMWKYYTYYFQAPAPQSSCVICSLRLQTTKPLRTNNFRIGRQLHSNDFQWSKRCKVIS